MEGNWIILVHETELETTTRRQEITVPPQKISPNSVSGIFRASCGEASTLGLLSGWPLFLVPDICSPQRIDATSRRRYAGMLLGTHASVGHTRLRERLLVEIDGWK
jgi:hypothetical protein